MFFCDSYKNSLEVIEIVNEKSTVNHPYIPGLFMLIEGKPLLRITRLLKKLIWCTHYWWSWILHPRKCGLASYVGITIDKPTIGVARNLLCRSILENSYIEFNKTILRYRLKNNRKDIHISVGHKISLETAIDIVKQLIKKSHFIPAPLRIADINSKKYSNF